MIALRNLDVQDKPEITRLMNSENVSRYMTDRVPFPYTLSDCDSFFEFVKNTPNDFFFAITLNNKVIGGLGLHRQPLNSSHVLELGYWIGEEYWNKGYASEAVKLGIQKAFSVEGITKIIARVYSGNSASDKVLFKNGFKEEGFLKEHIMKRGKVYDEKIFGLIKPI
ncbi:MAG: acetyltransferase [Bacteroidetes bacterium]|jgi:RimJ/RimL family protein N-acetyltransferase|nr:acetyltransferase [Bacteroidota bacterium]